MAVTVPEIGAAAAYARTQAIPVLALSTGVGAGHDAFFDAVRAALPLDPPLVSNRSWDALSDSLFGGLYLLGADRVLLVWMDAAEMVATAPEEAKIALAVLADVAATLAEPQSTQGRTVSLMVLTATESPLRPGTVQG